MKNVWGSFSKKGGLGLLRLALPVFTAVLLLGGAFLVLAQDADISYPVAELGGCTDQASCKTYCDDIQNIRACVLFAERHKLISEEEAEDARKFEELGGVGPGGCTTAEECREYCEDPAHVEECLAFGEEHGLMSEEELKEAKQVAEALRSGAKLPGGCNSKAKCDNYCSVPTNMRECLDFAEAAGFMSPEELEEARKIADYVASGGKMPGGCTSQDCEDYCEDEAHFDECIAFAKGAGLLSPEEAKMIEKTGGRGPGGCRGKACEAFCNNPENRQVCIDFALENDLMTSEEKRQMQEGAESAKRALEQASPEIRDCLRESLGDETIDKINSGTFAHGPEIGEKMRNCFEKYSEGPGQEGDREREGYEGDQSERGYPGYRDGEGEGGSMSQRMPPEMMNCAREIYGEDFESKVRSGEIGYQEFEGRLKDCVRKFFENSRPSGEGEHPMMPPPMEGQMMGEPAPGYMPPQGGFEGREFYDGESEHPMMPLAPESEPQPEPEPAPEPVPEPSSLGAQVISAFQKLFGL